MSFDFVNLSLVVLVPLVPAYLLFKALPASAEVSGPLQGLNIKLGGAFAGYFALVVLVLSTHSIWNPPLPYQVWEVNGKVVDEHGHPWPGLNMTNFELTPDSFRASPDGGFKLSFYTMPGQSGEVRFPALTFAYPEYEARTIVLDPADPEFGKQSSADKRDLERHVIRLQPIQIQKMAPYLPALTEQASAPEQNRVLAKDAQEHRHDNP